METAAERRIPVWGLVAAGWALALLLAAGIPAGRSGFFPWRVPDQPAGVDLAMMLGYSRAWLETGNPYAELNPYPPLAALAFAPLTRVPFEAARMLVAGLTVAAFASVALVLPLRVFPGADRRAVALAALAGLCSYGFWFELRWGQFNVLALACAAWGAWLFHRGRSRGARWAAYGLFSAGIQLKLYPAIFVVALARDARAGRGNLGRWAGLGAVNLVLLLAAGPRAFVEFLHSLRLQAAAPYAWAGNHSLQSFAEWTGGPVGAGILVAAWGGCCAWALATAARKGGRRAFAGLVMVCTTGALLLPGVSHDYKLAALPMAFAFLAGAAEPLPGGGLRGGREAGMFLALSVAVAWTQFSYAVKPAALQNNAPFLLAAAGLAAAWGATSGGREPAADGKETWR